MIPIGVSWKLIQTAIRRADQEALTLVKSVMQRNYYALCEKTDWVSLRRSKTLTFASSDSAGKILPSNLVNIIGVLDSEGNPVYPAEAGQASVGDGRCKWFFPPTAVPPLVDQDAAAISANETHFVLTPTLASDYAGEFIRFGAEPGIYEIASALTLASAYRGPKQDAARYQIRPTGTRMLAIVNDDGDFESKAVTVHYWAYPEPLTEDWQVPCLSAKGCRALELMTIIELVGLLLDKKERQADVYRNELERPDGTGVLNDAISGNPHFVSPIVPRNRYGSRIYFGRAR